MVANFSRCIHLTSVNFCLTELKYENKYMYLQDLVSYDKILFNFSDVYSSV